MEARSRRKWREDIHRAIPREIIRESCPVKSVSARRSRPLLSRDEYEIDESVSGGSKGRFHRLTGSRQTKLTMNGQLTWRLCQLTAMADVTELIVAPLVGVNRRPLLSGMKGERFESFSDCYFDKQKYSSVVAHRKT